MKRIQRKRVKGYRMPENAKYVGRPTKWGNPLKLIGDAIYIDASYRRKVLDKWVYLCQGNINDVVNLYEQLLTGEYSIDSKDMKYWNIKLSRLDLTELEGKDLACFCSLGNPCHADILLKLK